MSQPEPTCIEELVAQLTGMGFDLDRCHDAVKADMLTIPEAVQWILENTPNTEDAQSISDHSENTTDISSIDANGSAADTEPSPRRGADKPVGVKSLRDVMKNPESEKLEMDTFFRNVQSPSRRNSSQWTSVHWRMQLSALTELKEKHPEQLVQGLKQIIVCSNNQFKIGEGQVGTTVFVGLMTDGQEVAVKEVFKTGLQWKDSIQKEVDILVKIRHHEHILTYKLTEWPESRLGYIVTELCEFSLDKWFATSAVRNMPTMNWDNLVPSLVRDLLKGLNHLHSENPPILHRDIKPENVLVAEYNGKRLLKLADFGISRLLGDGNTSLSTKVAGTEEWRAAEVIRKGRGEFPYRPSTDIQVCGMVAYYIKTRGKHPFDADSPHEIEHKILNNQPDMPELVCGMVAYYIKSRGKHPFDAHSPHEVEHKILNNQPDMPELNEPVIQDFVESMLLPEPTDRPSAAELLRHPYFWPVEMRYRFLSTIGNEPEIVDSHLSEHKDNNVRIAIEAANSTVLPNGTDWYDLSIELITGMDKTRPSDTRCISNFGRSGYVTSTCKLVCTLRNFQEHFNHLSPGAKSLLGNTCFPYKFFDSRVPQLFLTVYKIIIKSVTTDDDWTKREALKTYFSD